jgi:hypothetical protein
VTVDELAHLPAGLVYWRTGQFGLYHHNPPLLRLLAAAPLAAAGVEAPEVAPDANRWRVGVAFQRALGERYHRSFLPARAVIAALTCLTALLLFAVARRALGWEAAALALALFCLNPLVLAHGALVTTDAGFALAFFATCVAAVAWLRRPSWARSLGLGVLLGLAQLTKFTALLLLPVLLLAILALPWLARRLHGEGGLGWLRLSGVARGLRGAAVLLTALLVLDAGYLFQGVGLPLAAHPLRHPLLRVLADSPLGALPWPLPANYVLGFDAQYREASGKFAVYLLGQLGTGGWWYYYPLALLFKLPLGFHVLLAALLVAVARRRVAPSLLLVGSLGVPAFALAAFVLLTDIDIGVRYLLFLLPFACLALAHWARPPLTRGRLWLIGACLASCAGAALLNHPHHLAYFSELCGGPSRGHRFLADSNLDWGQDLLRLRRFMREQGIDSVALSSFGLVDAGVYGIDHVPLDHPAAPETVVISVNHLLGIDPWGQAAGVEPYRGREPRARVGHSLWVFDRAAD